MLIDHLQKTFAERSRRNPQYSLRSFARALEIDSSTLSALLRRKRPLTAKQAQKLIGALDIQDPALAQNLLLGTISSSDAAPAQAYNELAIEAAEVISSWEHYAILHLLELDNFRGTARNISSRLNIPLGVVMECLARCEKLSLVQVEEGVWKVLTRNIAVVPNVPNQALKELHKQYIQMAMNSLDNVSREKRDVSGITMSVCSKKLPEASRMIQDFRRNLSAFLESCPRDSVYRLNIQLFPLTQEKQP
ncbi:MAG: TIGR02147 family protein [Proteobacteria bacterium]|nr:MAG: TIGR02147 family protein [Pseudomonadota bacterium]